MRLSDTSTTEQRPTAHLTYTGSVPIRGAFSVEWDTPLVSSIRRVSAGSENASAIRKVLKIDSPHALQRPHVELRRNCNSASSRKVLFPHDQPLARGRKAK